MAEQKLDLDHFRQRLDEMRASLQVELNRIDEEIGGDEPSESYGVTTPRLFSTANATWRSKPSCGAKSSALIMRWSGCGLAPMDGAKRATGRFRSSGWKRGHWRRFASNISVSRTSKADGARPQRLATIR
jgi:hypothetical protein